MSAAVILAELFRFLKMRIIDAAKRSIYCLVSVVVEWNLFNVLEILIQLYLRQRFLNQFGLQFSFERIFCVDAFARLFCQRLWKESKKCTELSCYGFTPQYNTLRQITELSADLIGRSTLKYREQICCKSLSHTDTL